MHKIGAAWCKTSQATNKQYLSVGIDKEILPLTIKENQFLTLHLNENKTEDKQPDYYVCLSQNDEKN